MEAGDFVRFLSDYSESNKSSDTQLIATAGLGKVISAVKLNENKVFIAHSYQEDEYVYLYSTLCTISGTTIKLERSTWLFKWASSINTNISVVALNENKVFVAYSYSTDIRLYGIVCTISGTTITNGTSTQLSSIVNSGKVISAVKLDEGKVFIAYSYGSSYYLYAMVCTINGTTITKGTDTQLSSIQNSGKVISAVALNENRVCIAHSYSSTSSSDFALYGIICAISGTSITKGTDTQLNSSAYAGNVISSVALNESKVFIAHSKAGSRWLNAIVCTISGTTITEGTDTSLGGALNTVEAISVVALNENKVFIAHCNQTNKYLYSVTCTISGTSISKETNIALSSTANSGSTISAIALSEKDIFIAHSSGASNYLYGMILGYLENLVKTITSSTERIDGIAITSGTSGQTVSIKKPNVK